MMPIIFLPYILIFISLSIILSMSLLYFRKQIPSPNDMNFFRFLKLLFLNFHRIHDMVVEILKENQGTVRVKSKSFIDVDYLVTCDPKNVRHITSTKFLAYPKGIEWKKRFDVFGDGIFNSDFEEWENHRTVLHGFLSHEKFNQVLKNGIEDKIGKCLRQYLEDVSKEEQVVDLKDVFQTLIFDMAYTMATGFKSNSLGVGLPKPPIVKALNDACETIFTRHIFAEKVWKLQSWLGMGEEKKLKKAWEVIDEIAEDYISTCKENLIESPSKKDVSFNLLEIYMTKHEVVGMNEVTHQVMRDNMLLLIFAIEDTTSTTLSWFFWLLSKHPIVEKKIIDELEQVLSKDPKECCTYTTDELNNMVYLHAALCEALRLFPPVPFEARTPMENDILPSGHHVDKKTIIILASYAMGRMKWVWGNDCDDFKPERWITDDGRIRYEPSFKFFSFNGGPRNCLGKNMAFVLMKTITATIMRNFHVQVVEKKHVTYRRSIVLHMKNELMVKIKARCIEDIITD